MKIKTPEEMLKGCKHDGSFIPVSEVIRLMKTYADQLELTDEEIRNQAKLYSSAFESGYQYIANTDFSNGAKWYKAELKRKRNDHT